MKKIVVDMMGSDLGSVATKEGVSLFHAKHPDVELILVGKEQELKDLTFAKIINAEDVVEMTCGALEVIRRKESSMVIALNMMDELTSNGGSIDVNEMEALLGVPVVPISAAKNEGVDELVEHFRHWLSFDQFTSIEVNPIGLVLV